MPVFERLASQIAPPGWRPALAWAHLQAGRPELARELIEEMSAGGFATTPRDSNFVARLGQVAHVVAELGDADLAASVEPLLAPLAEFWVVLGPAACTLGPIAYLVGELQLLLDRPADAAASFEHGDRALAGDARAALRGALAGRARGRAAPARRATRRAAEPRGAGRRARRASSGWQRLERELALAAAAA